MVRKMKKKRLREWLESPKARKRRIATERLTKSVKNSEEAEKIYENVKTLINDEDWSVRSKVATSLVELSLEEGDLREETITILKSKATDAEEHPNVRSTTIKGLVRLFETDPSLGGEAPTILEENLGSENAAVQLAILDLSKFLIKHRETTEKVKNWILEKLKSDNSMIRRKTLETLSEIYEAFDTEVLEPLFLERITDQNFEVRKAALTSMRKLYPWQEVSKDALKPMIRKKLRDPSLEVRKEVITLIFEMMQHSPTLSEDFLSEVTDEILRKTKNEDLLLLTLRLLEMVIDKIPTQIVNRYKLPKTLDILAINVPANSPKRKRIKILARRLLEEVLGYTVEERQKLRKPADH